MVRFVEIAAHMPNDGMYAPPACDSTSQQTPKKEHKTTLTPNDQSARLFVSMGEGRLTLAVASLYAHAYSHGDSHSPAFRYSRASAPAQVHRQPQGAGRRARQPRQSQRHFEGGPLPPHAQAAHRLPRQSAQGARRPQGRPARLGAPLPSGHPHRLAAPQPGAGGRVGSPVRRAPRALPARPGPARHGGAETDGRARRRVLAAPADFAPALAPRAGAAARAAAGGGDATLGGGWERVLVGPDDGAEC